ncbi:GGDEF domain-containing protein [Candidatus Kaiserbacteria bacterium]|nr:GGDEF domain-containing protein [Candidatus Kaiserbacteria bacterium]
MERGAPDFSKEKRKAKIFEWRAEELKGRVRDLQEKSSTDALTGLLNRRAFEQKVNAILEGFKRERRGDTGLESVSLLIVDIDRFKSINDTFGHPAGDEVLRSVAAVLKKHIERSSDIVGRLGGEEFAIGMVNPNGAVSGRAEAIRADIETSVQRPDGEPVTASIGIAETATSLNFNWLYEQADAALYHAKKAGRNRVEATPLTEAA